MTRKSCGAWERMDFGTVKKKVENFRTEYGIKQAVDSEILEDIFEKQGFTVIDFYHTVNDPDVQVLIDSLNISELAGRSEGFLYIDPNFRLVFVHGKLSADERRIVLAHEEGHYYCGHGAIKEVGRDVIEEYEANEFAHYLLTGSFGTRVKADARRHKKKIAAAAIAVSIIFGGLYAAKEYHERQLYEGEYYVTMHGEKYHLENCVTIQEHTVRRLTKEDVESGWYSPCSVCQPDNRK